MKTRAISTREFWLGVGSALVAGLVACIALFATCRVVGSLTTDYSIRAQLPSPTGERSAILYVGMGGGAAGWCYQHLAVAPDGAIFDPKGADAQLEYVFSASCASEVAPRWVSEHQLEVSYTLDPLSGTSLYQRPATRDGLVRLTFLPR